MSKREFKSKICISCKRSYIPTGMYQKYCKNCKNCKRGKRHLELRYNINEEDYQILFDAQNGCCAICGKHQREFKKALHVDHNHKTKLIRGLLCTKCNIYLGHYENRNKEKEVKKYLQTVPKRMLKIYKQWLMKGG